MKYKAIIESPWEFQDDANYPKVYLDYIGVDSAVDRTGGVTIPSPNVHITEIVCNQTTLDTIQTDPNYEIIWAEEIVDGE